MIPPLYITLRTESEKCTPDVDFRGNARKRISSEIDISSVDFGHASSLWKATCGVGDFKSNAKTHYFGTDFGTALFGSSAHNDAGW